jgi:hypothetical protein
VHIRQIAPVRRVPCLAGITRNGSSVASRGRVSAGRSGTVRADAGLRDVWFSAVGDDCDAAFFPGELVNAEQLITADTSPSEYRDPQEMSNEIKAGSAIVNE